MRQKPKQRPSAVIPQAFLNDCARGACDARNTWSQVPPPWRTSISSHRFDGTCLVLGPLSSQNMLHTQLAITKRTLSISAFLHGHTRGDHCRLLDFFYLKKICQYMHVSDSSETISQYQKCL